MDFTLTSPLKSGVISILQIEKVGLKKNKSLKLQHRYEALQTWSQISCDLPTF